MCSGNYSVSATVIRAVKILSGEFAINLSPTTGHLALGSKNPIIRKNVEVTM